MSLGRVYLSSTTVDLAEYRAEVRKVVETLGGTVDCMENYGPDPDRGTLARCRDDVSRADLYVGLFGFRYGDCPPDDTTSFTEHEFDAAVAAGKRRLLFLMTENALVRVGAIDRGDCTRIEALRAKVRDDGRMEAWFSNLRELSLQLFAALSGARAGSAVAAVANADLEAHRDALTRQLDELDVRMVGSWSAGTAPMRPVFDLKVSEKAKAVSDVPPVAVADARPARAHADAIGVLGDVAYPRILLVGEPQSGKSMLVRYVARRLAAGNEPADDRLRALDGHLPVLVRLRDAAASFENALRDALRSGLTFEKLRRHLAGGHPVVLFVDGLDKVTDPDRRAGVEGRIAGFVQEYPQVRVVVTARPDGYTPGVLPVADFATFALDELDAQAVDQVVRRLCTALLPDDAEAADKRATALLEALDDAVEAAPQLADRARNPLLLSLLAIRGAEMPPPGQRRRLYHGVVEVLLGHRGAANGPAPASPADRFDLVACTAVLGRIAERMLDDTRDGVGTPLRAAQVRDIVRTYAEQEVGLGTGDARAATQELLALFEGTPFLLVRNVRQDYSFADRTFQDYFYAEDLRGRLDDTAIADLAAVHGVDGRWRGTLRMLAAGLAPPPAAALIAALAARGRRGSFGGDDSPLRALALAVQCLAEIDDRAPVAYAGTQVLDALVLAVEQAVLWPDNALDRLFREVRNAVADVGHSWPDAERVLTWYCRRGARIVDATAAAWATWLTATLVPGTDQQPEALVAALAAVPDEESRDVLAGQLFELLAAAREGDVWSVAAEQAADVGVLPHVRGIIVREVARLAPEQLTGSARAILLDRLEFDGDAGIVRTAALGLHRANPDAVSVPAPLFTRTHDPDPAVRRAALETLFAWSVEVAVRHVGAEPTEETVDLWLQHLDVDLIPSALLRYAARTAAQPLLRLEALDCLMDREPRTDATVDLLGELVRRDPDERVLRTAVHRLAAVDRAEALEAFHDRDDSVDPVATARILDQLDPRWVTDELVPRIRQADTAAARRTAFAVLLDIRPGHEIRLDLARERAREDTDPEILSAALDALDKAGVLAEALDGELRTRHATDPVFRVAVAAHRRHGGPDDAALESRMEVGQKTADLAVHGDVARRHSRPARRLQALQTVVRLTEQPDPATAAARMSRDQADRLIRDLLTHDDDADVVQAAAEFALRRGLTDAADLLLARALGDRAGGDVTLRAEELLHRADRGRWTALPLLQAVPGSEPADFATAEAVRRQAAYGSPAPMRLAAADVLLRRAMDPDTSAAVIADHLDDPDPELRRRAVVLAARHPEPDPGLLDGLGRLAQHDRDPSLRLLGLVALSRSGAPQDRLLLAYGDAACADLDPWVRAVATHLYVSTPGATPTALPDLTDSTTVLRPDPPVRRLVRDLLEDLALFGGATTAGDRAVSSGRPAQVPRPSDR